MTGTFAAVPATETSSRPGGRGSAAGRGLPLGPSVTDKGDAPGRWDLLIYSFIIAESGGICEFGESVKGTTATHVLGPSFQPSCWSPWTVYTFIRYITDFRRRPLFVLVLAVLVVNYVVML